MTRHHNRLSARAAQTLGEGFHADGGGLYLRVAATGARRWVFVFFDRQQRREMGLGALADIPLIRARELVQDARALVKAGKNPIEERRRLRAAVVAVPFGELATETVEALAPQWRSPVTRQSWETTLTVDAQALSKRLVSEITTEDVLAVLKPIWLAKPDTARRVRQRIERVLDAAKARGMREGDNPARWKGHLSLLLAKTKHLRQNHPALPYARMKDFVRDLRETDSLSVQALDFTILTNARTGETRFAKNIEFDLVAGIWTIPGGRTKSGRDHRVPLSAPALEIARRRIEATGGGYLFPGKQPNKPLSNMAMTKVLKVKDYGTFTVHGFRSTFRDWAGDCTVFPREIIEAAMAHIVGDEAEQAYRRSDALERRRALMDAWAVYCDPAATATVVRLSAQR